MVSTWVQNWMDQEPAGFTPATLFAGGIEGAWYDPSDLSSVWQDSSGTTAGAVGSPVGRIDDKSGNGNNLIQATTSKKPILRQDASSNYYLEFDGVDDSMASTSIDFTAADEVSLCLGLTKDDDNTAALAAEFSPTIVSNNGSLYVAAPENTGAGGNYTFNAKGTSLISRIAFADLAPDTSVLTALAKISTPVRTLRTNGTQRATSSASIGTGNFGNHQLYIGQRGGSSLPLTGRIYGVVFINNLLSGTDLSDLETFIADKTGVTL